MSISSKSENPYIDNNIEENSNNNNNNLMSENYFSQKYKDNLFKENSFNINNNNQLFQILEPFQILSYQKNWTRFFRKNLFRF